MEELNITIRTMTESDWSQVSRIFQAGVETGIATFQSLIPSWETWNENYHQTCRFVAECDGKVIGWIALAAVSKKPPYSGVAEISVYIDDEMRGKGVGTRLINEVISCSETHGFWMLQAVIIQKNEASIALHKKCGFREVGYRERPAVDRFGQWQNTVLLERRSPIIN